MCDSDIWKKPNKKLGAGTIITLPPISMNRFRTYGASLRTYWKSTVVIADVCVIYLALALPSGCPSKKLNKRRIKEVENKSISRRLPSNTLKKLHVFFSGLLLLLIVED